MAARRSRESRPGVREGHTPEGAVFTELLLEIFRANALLVAAGNRLAGKGGISLARWQVLGALAFVGRPLTVAQLGRAIGQTRQSIHRLVDDMEAAGLVARHRHATNQRALPVSLTDQGQAALRAASKAQEPWANRISKGIGANRLAAALRTIRDLTQRLEYDN